MAIIRPTPTCTHHRTTEIVCLVCLGAMRLITIEPGGPNFELRNYSCPQCESAESFLMAISQPLARANESPQVS
jgi:hypothetical protein